MSYIILHKMQFWQKPSLPRNNPISFPLTQKCIFFCNSVTLLQKADFVHVTRLHFWLQFINRIVKKCNLIRASIGLQNNSGTNDLVTNYSCNIVTSVLQLVNCNKVHGYRVAEKYVKIPESKTLQRRCSMAKND